ncbi:hypothetical protein [Nocardioides sp.]|uniref:hypothetical protein n=1 Tax=Nocardioides sp. TaxID=35761 RepID=UPI0031FF04BE|nr:hypothetical protein [Nocardioides sp.]
MEDGASDDTSESGFDLFDRWLAHHDEKAAEGDRAVPAPPPVAAPATQPVDDPALEAEAESDPEPEADAAPASRQPEVDPLFDESFPTDDSEEEPEFALLIETETPAEISSQLRSNEVGRSILDALAAPSATRITSDPVTPDNFEPVIIPSARKRAETRRSRLTGRRKDVDPVPVDVPIATAPVPDLAAVQELVQAERAAREQADEDRVAQAQAAAQQQAEAEQAAAEQAERAAQQQAAAEQAAAEQAEAERAERAAQQQAEAERVAAQQQAEAEQAERAAQQQAEAEQAEAERAAAERAAAEQAEAEQAAAEQAEARATAEAQRDAPEEALSSAESAQETDPRVDHVDAGREVFAAFEAAKVAAPEPTKRRRPAARPKPEAPPAEKSPPAVPVEREKRPVSAAEPAETQAVAAPVSAAREPAPDPQPEAPMAVGRSTNVDFAPKTGTRRLVGILLLISVAATAVAGYVAYNDRTTFNQGVAGTLGLLTLVVWAVRAGSTVPRLSVRSGQLEIRAGDGRFVFDLASRYTPIEVVGRPGERGWKVLFLRRSMAPYVVDASMVDAEEFMRVLRQHRPEHD